MKVSIEIEDTQVIEFLKEMLETRMWCSVDYFEDDIRINHLEDFENFFEVWAATNRIIEYLGGNRMDIRETYRKVKKEYEGSERQGEQEFVLPDGPEYCEDDGC